EGYDRGAPRSCARRFRFVSIPAVRSGFSPQRISASPPSWTGMISLSSMLQNRRCGYSAVLNLCDRWRSSAGDMGGLSAVVGSAEPFTPYRYLNHREDHEE